nr:hypothetical protein [Shewanella avicenniae]
MLASLRHHAVIAGQHQQRMARMTHAHQHVIDKFFVARHINKCQTLSTVAIHKGVAKINGHATAFFFRQPVSIDAR